MILVRVLLGGCSRSRGALYDQLRHVSRSFRGLYYPLTRQYPNGSQRALKVVSRTGGASTKRQGDGWLQ
jgi:hypothetical protein